MSTLVVVIQIILAGMFSISSFMKLKRTPSMVQHWNEYRYPMWFLTLTGLGELAGVIALLAGFLFPALLPYVGVFFVALMLGAIHAHLFRAKHRPVMAVNAAFMLALSIVMIIATW
ncbi:doxX family protein [Paenibacillus sp. A3]|uniref:DoxX family protein n=1 Tax=Paenibacillus sp. A3 TaxID=1337054 RepID=UPI0006D5B58B|nr:DoxX family protein [Paenibacillus sp. A3]KPV57248.1 doxX family protein [Paenibacillus sp. A3]